MDLEARGEQGAELPADDALARVRRDDEAGLQRLEVEEEEAACVCLSRKLTLDGFAAGGFGFRTLASLLGVDLHLVDSGE